MGMISNKKGVGGENSNLFEEDHLARRGGKDVESFTLLGKGAPHRSDSPKASGGGNFNFEEKKKLATLVVKKR